MKIAEFEQMLEIMDYTLCEVKMYQGKVLWTISKAESGETVVHDEDGRGYINLRVKYDVNKAYEIKRLTKNLVSVNNVHFGRNYSYDL